MLSVVMLLVGLVSASAAHAQGGYTDDDVYTCSRAQGRQKLTACLKLTGTGNVGVYVALARLYEQGAEGVAKDGAEAAKYRLLAAQKGDVESMVAIGSRLHLGKDIEKDALQALYWYRKGANAGDLTAQWLLGTVLLDDKDGPASNAAEAIPWLLKIARVTQPDQLEHALSAQRNLLMWFSTHPTPENRALQREWHQRLASTSDGVLLGVMTTDYFLGRGVEADSAKAKAFAIRAIDAGNVDAYSTYGFLLLLPEVGQPNYALARQVLEKGRAAGNPLCDMLLTDLDIYEGKATQDPVRFREHLEASWVKFEKYCETNKDCNFTSAKLVAVAREAGFGGPKNLKGAREVYDKQSKRGTQGTESRFSEGNPWAQRDNRLFWQKSLLTEVPAYTSDQQLEFGITKLRDVTATPASKPATRPVLEFDIQVFIDKTTAATEAQIVDHINSAARLLSTCDVRLRKARLWREDSSEANDKINLAPQPVINVFIGHPRSDKKTAADARMNDKSVRIYWYPGQIEAGGTGRGRGSTILSHELAHVFAVPHPNNLNASVMQYGLLSSLAQTFTPEECDLMRKHELLATTGSSAGTSAQPQSGTANSTTKSSAPRGAKSSASAAMNARYEAVFTDLRDLMAKNNRGAFARYTLHALALKHQIPWSDVANLLTIAMNWRAENTFSAGRDFTPGQPADTKDFDEVFFKKDDIKAQMENDLGAIRKYIVESNNLNVASLNVKEHVDLKVGQVWPTTLTQTVSKVSDGDKFTQFVVGDDFYTVDPKTNIIVHVQPRVLNLTSGPASPELFVPRGSKMNAERLAFYAATQPSIEAPTQLGFHRGLTPSTIPGGTVVTPEEVVKMLEGFVTGKGPGVATISAITAPVRIYGAYGAAAVAAPGDFNDANQKALSDFVKARGFEKGDNIVTYCHHSQCWASYNLALRLIALGFTNVKWMREGLNGWIERDYPLMRSN